MASSALRHVLPVVMGRTVHTGRSLRTVPALVRWQLAVPRRWLCSLPMAYDDDEIPAAPKVVRLPKRRWMSVSDLVSEAEHALVKGERLEKGGSAYQILQREAARLRMENDTIISDSEKLAVEREQCVAEEDDIHRRILINPGVVEDLVALAAVGERIQSFDHRLAGLRQKQVQNIRDVGALKRTMYLIEKKSEVAALVDRVENFLMRSTETEEEEEGPVTPALNALAEHLSAEYKGASQKVRSYEQQISELLQGEEALQYVSGRSPDQRDARMGSVQNFYKAKRMIFQLQRLLDIQILNFEAVILLERARSRHERHNEIRCLVERGNAKELADKVQFLQEDTAELRSRIKRIEAGLEKHIQEAYDIIAKLRSKPDLVTPETGKWREQLMSNIHQKEHWKFRLAALRGEKIQNLRWLTHLQAAVAAK